MAFSQVSVDESLRVKKKLYMNEMDEYSGSSQPLNSKSNLIRLLNLWILINIEHPMCDKVQI